MPVSGEVDPRFTHFITKLGIRKDVAAQLWNAEICSPQELASSEIEDVRKIANNPVLINVVMPQLYKNVFAITMASDPYAKTLDIFETLSGGRGDIKMDVDVPAPTTAKFQSDGQCEEIQAEAAPIGEINIPVSSGETQSTWYRGGENPDPPLSAGPTNGTTQAQTSQVPPVPQCAPNQNAVPPRAPNIQNGQSQHIRNTNMYVGASGTGRDRVRMQQNQSYYETDALRAGSGNKIVITGGNFVQANLLGRSTFHNVGSHIETTLGDADDLAVRRKTKLNSSFYMNGELVPTAELLWREGEFWLDRLNMQSAAPEQYDQHFSNENVYKVNNWGQSEAIIVNNIRFGPGVPRREGADKDTTVIKDLVSMLGFNPSVYEDKRGEGIRQLFREFSQSAALHKSSMLWVYIGSHGERDKNGNDVFLGSDNERVSLNEIMDMFSNDKCPALRGKPKLFFFQFCRKDNTTTEPQPSTSTHTQHDASQNQQQGIHRMSDFLKAFSTQPGQQAYRDTTDGSWFVTAISKVFADSAHKEDVLSMLTKVNNSVSVNRGRENGRLVVQLSEFQSNLTKKVYFFPRNPTQEQ